MGLNVELLEKSFAVVAPRGEALVSRFYERLFQKYPAVEPMFAKASMADQKKKLLGALALVIQNLRKPEKLQQALRELGARHVRYGTQPAHYDAVAENLLAVLAEFAGAAWTPTVHQAWAEALTDIKRIMLEGAAADLRTNPSYRREDHAMRHLSWSSLQLGPKIIGSTTLLILVTLGSIGYWFAGQMENALHNRLVERAAIIQRQIEVTRAYLADQYVGKIKASAQGMVKVATEHAAADTVPLPATATREIAEELAKDGYYSARVISRTPLNPANAPKGQFEEDAVAALARGETEARTIEVVNGATTFRRITPDRVTSQACIGCHTNAKLGDIVGAVSIQIPMSKPLAQLNRDIAILYVTFGGVALLICGLLGVVIRREVLRPLWHVQATAEELGKGNFAARLDVARRDQIGATARAFNVMADQIQAAIVKQQDAAKAMYMVQGSLDNSSGNVLMCDRNLIVTYVNKAAKSKLKTLEADIRKALPSFNADTIVGTCIDSFHKMPDVQRRLLADPRNLPHRADIQLGPLTLALTVSAILSDSGDYLGNTLEWEDVSAKRKVELEMARLKASLDNARSNVLVCDRTYTIVYANNQSVSTLRRLESDIRKVMPGFAVDKVVGSSIDTYHKNPGHQRQLLDNPKNLPFKTEIKIGPLALDLAVAAIMNEKGEYLGNVVEWADITAQKKAQVEVDKLINAAAAGQLAERINAEEFDGFFKALSQGVNKMLDAVVTPLHEAQQVLTALAANDLTKSMTGSYQGEFEQMKVSLNSAIQTLGTALTTVREAAESVTAGAEQITKGNEDLSQRTSEQASSLEETSASMEEMTSTVKQNADNAKQANQLAIAARDTADKGGAVTVRAVEAMGEINKSSKKIADIITVIDEIAFQTNLLALNAAVEAARAGEHGRGFAVVAAEVRNLAQRSATAAKEIKGLINESIQRVNDGSDLVNQSGKTLEEIVNSVKRVTDIIAEITAASQEQASGIDQVNKAIMQMDETTQQNAALVEETTSASQSMKDQARELMQQVEVFKLNNAEGHGAARPKRDLAGLAKPAGKPPVGGGLKPALKKPMQGGKPAAAKEPAGVAAGNGHDRRQHDDFEEF